MQGELVEFFRVTQVGFERQPLDRPRLDLGGEETEIVFALFLGEVHGDICVLGQGQRIAAVFGKYGNADAPRRATLMPSEHYGQPQGC